MVYLTMDETIPQDDIIVESPAAETFLILVRTISVVLHIRDFRQVRGSSQSYC